jgi:3-phenylpropionate/cinnamic acid dioxygenase small subunit
MRPVGKATPANDPAVSRSIFDRGPALNPATPVCGEIANFLHFEAELLDEDLHEEWFALLADDLAYAAPGRNTLYRSDGRGYDSAHNFFYDDKASMGFRVKRSIGIEGAHDRDPPPRVRRMISNIMVHETGAPDEYFVVSSLLVLRNRYDEPQTDMMSGRREDVLRRAGGKWQIARRTILVDQANLGSIFLNVFM